MKLSEKVIEWTRNYFEACGRDTAVIGISGGKDSAVVAAILVKAIGAENVIGVLMPNGIQKDISDSYKVCKELGIRHIVSDISKMYNAAVEPVDGIEITEEAAINIAPRLRTMRLYSVAQSLRKEGRTACVIGTGNKAEITVGYFTKWGDGACDMNPIKDLWVHEVIQVGDELGYYPDIVHKVPADGLCGKSDEERLGFSYYDVYNLCVNNICDSNEKRQKITERMAAAKHKIDPIPYYKNV